jgi:hypothetical protein
MGILSENYLIDELKTSKESSLKLALIGFSSKGPLNLPVCIKNVKELHHNFGTYHPNKNTYLIHVAEEILKTESEVLIIRANFNPVTAQNDKIKSITPGAEGNLTHVKVEKDKLEVYYDSKLVESWCSLNITKINNNSDWIQLDDKITDGFYELSGGSDGEFNENNILECLKSLEDYDIDIISIPGITSINIINNLLDFCEKKNYFSIIDTPENLSFLESYRWKNELNKSDYGAVFWPWLGIWDKGYVPPCSLVLNKFLGLEPWLNVIRGSNTCVLDLQKRPSKEEKMIACDKENVINMISFMWRSGIFILNNSKTLAGNGINTRRMLNYLRKKIQSHTTKINIKSAFFEEKFLKTSKYYLDQLKNGRCIDNYTIQIGDGLYSPSEIISKFKARIGVQPVETTDYIYLDFKLDSGLK